MSALRVVRPELVTTLPPDNMVRLKNRLRGVLRQTVMGLMKVEPPKTPPDASRYHVEISDIWAEGFLEAMDIYHEEHERYAQELRKAGT
jgi:hypothetical protein